MNAGQLCAHLADKRAVIQMATQQLGEPLRGLLASNTHWAPGVRLLVHTFLRAIHFARFLRNRGISLRNDLHLITSTPDCSVASDRQN